MLKKQGSADEGPGIRLSFPFCETVLGEPAGERELRTSPWAGGETRDGAGPASALVHPG